MTAIKPALRLIKYGLPFAGGFYVATKYYEKENQMKTIAFLIFIIILLIMLWRYKR